MVLLPKTPNEVNHRPPRPELQIWVRGGLVVIAMILVGVFGLAAWLNPYRDGRVWLEETHRQLGFPSCSFKRWTEEWRPGGLPCPSCGMTSSFALLVRGDVHHSLQANAVGTLLALFLAALIPWSLVSAWHGRWLFVRSIEPVGLRLVVWFLVLMMVRWGIVLLWGS